MQLMLSLNECVTVGSVQIKVLEVRHDSVKLGIINPDASPTYSEEILYLPSDDDDGECVSSFEPGESQQFTRFAFSFQ